MSARGFSAALMIAATVAILVTPKDAALNVSNVTIVTMDTHYVVVSRKLKGKSEEVRFVLNSETVRKGNLRIGSKVTVHYTVLNHENIATSIQTRD
jgi:hypothetical protein